MGVFIDDNKFLIIAEPKTISINLPLKINESPENDIKLIISCKKSFAEFAIKNHIRQLLFKYGYDHKKELSYLLESLNST